MRRIISIFFLSFGLVLIHGCSNDDFPVPLASTVPKFSYTVDGDFAPVTITFKNESIVPARAGDVTYYWNFGDGTTSSEVNPSHFYNKAGVYSINLVVLSTMSNEINDVLQTVIIKDPNATGIPIYFTDGSAVYGGLINEYTPIMSSIGITSLGDSYGMALDTANNVLYISDYDNSAIYTADVDGQNFKVFRSDIGQPDGIAIDYDNKVIYWDTDEGIRKANMADPDVNQYTDFVTGQENDPEGLAIDLVNGKLYWNNYDGGVWVKNLDGSGEKEIVSTGGGGSILVIEDHIYFDDYIESGDARLKYANLDGASVGTVATGISKRLYGLAYDAEQSKIYWTDRSIGTIMRSDLDGSNAEPWYVNENINPRGIVIGKSPEPEI